MAWSLQQLVGSAALTGGPSTAGDPSVVVYNNQMHVCYLDAPSNIQDAWFDGSGHWQSQPLTGAGGRTSGAAANGDPKPVTYNNQMHVCYRDASGSIQDAWYDGATGNWALQPLTGTGGVTVAPAAAGDPVVIVDNAQMHVCYRDVLGNIQDVWFDGSHWQPQQITGAGGISGGPVSANDPNVVAYENQMHVCYYDASGNIQDAWYDGATGHWKWQILTGSRGVLPGQPSGIGGIFAAIYNGQMHVCYRDASGNIQDVWFDGSRWQPQQLTGTGGIAGGPVSASDPSVVAYDNQMHVCYRDGTGNIQDAWYDGAVGKWVTQPLTGGGLTSGPPTPGRPAVVVYDDQIHVCYRDTLGEIWDAWYADGPSTSATLLLNEQLQQQTNWCWAATTVSITLYYEVARQLTQCQVVNQQLDLSSCCTAPQGWSLQPLTGIGSLTGGADLIGNLAIADYNDQMHVVYRDWGGNIQDAWYDGATGSWAVQPLAGADAMTGAPEATGDPAVNVYNKQIHVCYRDALGNIQDVWFDASHWNPQQLTGAGGISGAPVSASDPSVVSYGEQMHVCYYDGSGNIQDAWYDRATGHWNWQTLTGSGGLLPGMPPGIGGIFVAIYTNQMHACYRDSSGNIQDVWFDGSHWQPQQLTGAGGISGGPVSASDPSVVSYNDQMHVCYYDGSGNIQDAWYDGAAGHWKWQTLTGSSGVLFGQPAGTGRVSAVTYDNQMHVCYLDTSGDIQDVWYDGSGNWSIQQLNGAGGLTSGPLANGSPMAIAYVNQMHVCYPDKSGGIQDAWYSGQTCNVTGYPDKALRWTGHYADEKNNPLTLSEVVEQIAQLRPIAIRIAWTGGGAHNPAIDGYDTAGPGDPTIDVEDPIYGHSVQDFNTFPTTYQGGATWTDTYLTS